MGSRRDTPRTAPGEALAARIRRHPRLWGFLLAALLLGAYPVLLRPARVWTAAHLAAPLLAAVGTPEARPHVVVPPEAGATVVLTVPERGGGVGGEGVTAWGAPAGLFFLLPALVLVARFPARPLWLYLLGAHVALGAITLAAFALGQWVGWLPFARAGYAFTATYIAAIVNLAVPLLLFLAGRAERPPRASASGSGKRERPPSGKGGRAPG